MADRANARYRDAGRIGMKLTVFGATGGIGGEMVRQALDAGHEVVAVVRAASLGTGRGSATLAREHPSLRVVQVTGLADPAELVPALRGADAALSGVGPKRRKDGPVASSTTRVILRALADSGVKRFVAVSATPVGPVPPGDSLLNRRLLLPLIGAILRDTYRDLGAMEEAIRDSGTEWTVVRPPRLVDGPPTGRYRRVVGGNVPRGHTIRRADVAHAMLAALADPATIGQAVGVAL
jgi:uncharacterized protein YbjT (DUF2867 family)